MTGWWLASYAALWVVALALCAITLGVLRQLGLLQNQVGPLPHSPVMPPLDDDGPAIGSRIPDLVIESVNGSGTVSTDPLRERTRTLVAFMSPMCEACQYTVGPLNAMASDMSGHVRCIVVVHGSEQTVQAFLSVFPLHAPAICDRDGMLTKERFQVHRNPFGLLYDEDGRLVRKGTIEEGHDGLRALLGDPLAPPQARIRVYPHVSAAEPQARAEV